RGHVPDPGDRQLRGPLRHPDDAPRIRRKRLRPQEFLRLQLRQWLLGRRQRGRLVRQAQASPWSQAADGGRTMKTFKALAFLLAYPEPELLANLDELTAATEDEGLLPVGERRALERFMAMLGRLDALEAQEQYVALFERNRSLSLHIYEHVH